MYAVLSGGTGTPKLLQGLCSCLSPEDLFVVVNTGEDTWVSGTYLSPDIDSVLYACAGIIDRERWYGIEGDSFVTHEAMVRLGYRELLRMGDRDRATKLYRTVRLGQGAPLSVVTAELCERLGVAVPVAPMSDDPVTTRIHTEQGELSFHEYWVRDRARPAVTGVAYRGCADAVPCAAVSRALERARAVILGPSNPVTSLGPILSLPGIRSRLEGRRVIAVSPFRGPGAFSGPADALMRGIGLAPDVGGLADRYAGIADELVIDRADADRARELEGRGFVVHVTDIGMKDLYTQNRLGEYIRDILG